MASLVGELLDLTQLQMGKGLDLNRRSTDLVVLVARAVDEQRELSGSDRVTLSTDLAELIGMWDADRIERVVTNLLSNAVKYSPDTSTVIVSIHETDDDNAKQAVLTVRDEGIGIPADDVPHIFDRFH